MNTRDQWSARRRGRAVIIRGFVVHPRNAKPIFDRIPEPRPDTRTYRFYFNPPEYDPEFDTLQWVEHTEPDVPTHVRTLKILLQNGETVWIRSQQPNPEP